LKREEKLLEGKASTKDLDSVGDKSQRKLEDCKLTKRNLFLVKVHQDTLTEERMKKEKLPEEKSERGGATSRKLGNSTARSRESQKRDSNGEIFLFRTESTRGKSPSNGAPYNRVRLISNERQPQTQSKDKNI